jgi:hypothetical protein
MGALSELGAGLGPESRWKTRKEAVASINRYVNSQMRKTYQSSKSSGSEVILYCHGNKNKVATNEGCCFMVRIRKTKSKNIEDGQVWYIPSKLLLLLTSVNGLNLQHSISCLAITKIPKSKSNASLQKSRSEESELHIVASAMLQLEANPWKINLDLRVDDTYSKESEEHLTPLMDDSCSSLSYSPMHSSHGIITPKIHCSDLTPPRLTTQQSSGSLGILFSSPGSRLASDSLFSNPTLDV